LFSSSSKRARRHVLVYVKEPFSMTGQIHIFTEENIYDLDRGGGIFGHDI